METNFRVILLKEKIKDLWEKGYTHKQITSMCDSNKGSISRFMKKLDLNSKQKVHESELKIIKESSTQKEAAEKLCITPSSVSLKIKQFKKLGLM